MAGMIALILALQLIGEALVRLTDAPVPGPVVGMLLLVALLVVRGGPPPALSRLAETLLGHLSLLFIPAGVGVISYLGLLADRWLAVTVTVIASTLISLLATALTLRFLLNRGPEDPS
ncbi:CidA/LrgA family protein [Spiribacter roseus]|uniref:CidA/LrgA family protein n=1 Tax=Spiribacter roseus TaxID=1855875 RepID=UPI001330351B|nr:CidA/LrgA family protein [Spiribacter roseus]KAF0282096.1 murein hydrolase transporter LrgA [Spiribacter roseus]KAF0283885.1 murein hydrolase transporter LrgA [Spiribacter roseus]